MGISTILHNCIIDSFINLSFPLPLTPHRFIPWTISQVSLASNHFTFHLVKQVSYTCHGKWRGLSAWPSSQFPGPSEIWESSRATKKQMDCRLVFCLNAEVIDVRYGCDCSGTLRSSSLQTLSSWEMREELRASNWTISSSCKASCLFCW